MADNGTDDKFKRLNQHVYELYGGLEDCQVEFVFFPGLQLSKEDTVHAHWKTWTMRRDPDDCWLVSVLPRLLQERAPKWKPRVLSVRYEASADTGPEANEASDEYLIAENLMYNLIRDAGVGQRDNVPVILVGHELGGFLIKYFVTRLEKKAGFELDEKLKAEYTKFLANLRHVFFFATPVSGSSEIEKVYEGIRKESKNQMLEYFKVLSARSARINSEFRQIRLSSKTKFKTHGVLPCWQTNQKGFKNAQVVVEGSARNDVDALLSARCDHFQVCQPEDEKCSVLQFLINGILE